MVPLLTWCSTVERVTELNVPWRALASRLVSLTEDGKHVLYRQSVRVALGQSERSASKANINAGKQESAGVTETLYRHKATLEMLFRFMDKDSSGLVSMKEFLDACDAISP